MSDSQTKALPQSSLDTLFTQARTYNAWLDRPVSDELLHKLYDLLKLGPTSANSSPGRFIFIRSPEGKARMRPALSLGNLEKTMSAPVTVIVAHDLAFYDKLPELFPHTDARSWFTGSETAARETAFRNGSLQGGYLILAARSLGLDAGPMSGFDAAKVDAEFFAGTSWTANFLVNLGYGNPEALTPRLPRLPFDEASQLV